MIWLLSRRLLLGKPREEPPLRVGDVKYKCSGTRRDECLEGGYMKPTGRHVSKGFSRMFNVSMELPRWLWRQEWKSNEGQQVGVLFEASCWEMCLRMEQSPLFSTNLGACSSYDCVHVDSIDVSVAGELDACDFLITCFLEEFQTTGGELSLVVSCMCV